MNLENRTQNVMILGSGGREDALALKLRKSSSVGDIFVAPGNGGTERYPNTHQVLLDPMNFPQVLEAVGDHQVGLVVVGPEDLLIAGIADNLRGEGIDTFGPGKAGAMLEGSKIDAVRFMTEYGIPHPDSAIFDSVDKALAFLDNPMFDTRGGVVVKADGPAGGKGVIVCQNNLDAEDAIKRMMVQEEFGQAGKRIVIQERLRGFEVSATVIVANGRYVVLPYSEDHKQRDDGDKGPNTGGMGTVAPHPLVDEKLARWIESEIVRKTVDGLKKEGIDFRGVLYPGIMMTEHGPKVLEYNVRFGDPETEAIVPLLTDDIYPYLKASAQDRFNYAGRASTRGSCTVVTLASGGYPRKYETGKAIYGLDTVSGKRNVVIFHAGTAKNTSGEIVSSGGRVLMVAGLGDSLEEASVRAYGIIGPEGVHFEDMHYRKDIGGRRR